MIVDVTGSKYAVGCNRGYGIEVPNLVLKLNLIVDKKRSTWPINDTRTQEEKESGVPAPAPEKTELEEGDVFVYEGTVFAIDHDRLVQIVSETGPLALNRIWENQIKPEIEFSYFEDNDNEYSWEELKTLPEEESVYQRFVPPYEQYKIWKENFVKDRNLRPIYTIEVKIKDSMIGFTRSVYLRPSGVFYKEQDFSEEELKFYFKKIMCWFYSEVGRVTI